MPSPLPEGPWLNVGSGPTDAAGWTHLDGSWQTRLSAYPWILPIGRLLLKKEIGHWPRAVKYCDVRRGLEYPSESVAVVYSSHMLEHLHRTDALRFLKDAHRVLKPGGACRIVVPDVGAIVGWYLDHQREAVANGFSQGNGKTNGNGNGNGHGNPYANGRGASSNLLMDMLLLRPREIPEGRGPAAWVKRAATIHEHKWMYDPAGLRALFLEAGFTSAEPRTYLESVIPAETLKGVEAADRVCNGAGACVEARK